jgi:hypothetical protein
MDDKIQKVMGTKKAIIYQVIIIIILVSLNLIFPNFASVDMGTQIIYYSGGFWAYHFTTKAKRIIKWKK